ncbi:hypothetical protein [Planktomarina sp.]|uniref:hypothetical protein n=1 Tax=Planktomarina sp. TaxID=2024851 RepID=UPI0032608C35
MNEIKPEVGNAQRKLKVLEARVIDPLTGQKECAVRELQAPLVYSAGLFFRFIHYRFGLVGTPKT